MKKSSLMFLSIFLIYQEASAQIITHSNGEIEIPNVTSNAGPLGLGSLLYFSSGSGNTVIQENWGLNLIGEPIRPVKIYSASLLVGVPIAAGTNYGVGNAYINGNVGIGTTNPLDKLDIFGTTAGNAGRVVFGDGGNYTPYMKFFKWAGSGSIYNQTTIVNSIDAAGAISFQTGTGGAAIGSDVQTTRMIITQQGNVGIGTINPNGYMLAINGPTIATSMTVKAYANWPDYVFKTNYHLPSLADVKIYIDKNHHLPDMPSEQEVAKDGLNLGDVDKVLTKKVEELTLYLIEKDQQINKQETKIIQQQADIDQLKQQMTLIMKNLNK